MRFGFTIFLISAALAQNPPDAREILRRVQEKYSAVTQYELVSTIHVTNRRKSDGQVVREAVFNAHVAFALPDRVREELEGQGADGIDVYSDGATAWLYSRAQNEYAVVPASDDAVRAKIELARLARDQVSPSGWENAMFVREERIGDADCYVVGIHDPAHSREEWLEWIDKRRSVILRQEDTLDATGTTLSITRMDFTAVKLGEPLPDSLFQFTPPPGAKQVESLNR